MTKAFSHSSMNHAQKQRGLSLIETMVGLTIGLFVVLSALGTLVVSKQANTDMSESYRLSSAGNLAMRTLAYTIRQAGSAELDQPNGTGTAVSLRDSKYAAASATGDQIVSGTDGGTTGTDTLTVSYEHRANTVTRDCLGNAPTIPTGEDSVRIDNVFAVTTNELRCTGRNGTNNTNIAAAQALVGDNGNTDTEIQVEDFQLWYWVQNATGTGQRRITQANIATNGGWPAVVAVEVCLQLRGIRTDYPTADFENCKGTTTANGGRLHQLFRGTYLLRNRQ